MDIQAYIASGILENYVLGVTSSEETAEVERLALTHPEVKAEIENIRTTLETYIMTYETTPSTALKQQIWDKIENLEGKAGVSYAAADNAQPRSRIFRTYLVAASVAALVISLGANVFLYNALNQTQQRLAQANAANQQIAFQLRVNQAQYGKTSAALAFIRNPDTRSISLEGQDVAPEASVTVFWNANEQDVYVSVNNLALAPAGKQYQLWAIVDGKPVDAGLVEQGEVRDLQQMKDIAQAQAFAVSLENTGGSTTAAGPQGPIYALGTI